MSPNWNMGEVLGHRIRALVTYRTDLANHIHFARLFQSQLIAVSKRATTGDFQQCGIFTCVDSNEPV